MNTNGSQFILYLVIVASIALLVHALLKHYWIACAVGAIGSSFINVLHEAWKLDFKIDPADVAFWIPALLIMGVAIALPVVILVGLPFWWFRNRSKVPPSLG